MPVHVRPARPRDLLTCARVIHASIRDLVRRIGAPSERARVQDYLPFLRHALGTDPEGFQVGVVQGKVVCYAITILRGRTQFLAQFFAQPKSQSLGIGRQVLAAAFEAPHAPPGTIRCLIASPDVRAQSLYLKFGMQPRTMVYALSGVPVGGSRDDLELHQVGPAGGFVPRARGLAARFDPRLRGARRDVDFRLWFNTVKGTRFFEVRRGRATVGYIVIRGNGTLGPGGVLRPALSGPLMSSALAEAHALGIRKVRAFIPGRNEGALQAALAAGLRIEFPPAVWMASRDVGDLRSYLPSGGVLF